MKQEWKLAAVQSLDPLHEISSLVIKAYALSLLLLFSVLVWSLSDAWMRMEPHAEDVFMPAYNTGIFDFSLSRSAS
uniref:Uncharacterized protein n=1 Tax=Physcomitrium patens TaxID=3218 RepID=A0A2K1JGX0_PHYPA|nr:hypothetical protein PHYPA_017938 [Physcomitrium patens]